MRAGARSGRARRSAAAVPAKAPTKSARTAPSPRSAGTTSGHGPPLSARRSIHHSCPTHATSPAAHPSQNARPSKDDDRLTERIRSACEVMRIFFADHIIVTDGRYYSYREEGRL